MRTQLSVNHDPCLSIRGEEPSTRKRHEAKTRRSPFIIWILSTIAVLFLVPIPAVSQDHGSGGGHEGGGGCGDVFGDLIHILRDDLTGQPIFAQRWIELPKEVPGYGWGYCPIAVDEGGGRIPFLPYSCDFEPDFSDSITEVDYFGRLNGGRTKERNQRMHFDEVISNITQAGQLRLDPTGRLEMGFGNPLKCNAEGDPGNCNWSAVDSPMESMALYVRLMKYGHLATDPMEVDIWAKGDPAAGIQYHPALSETDWPKFQSVGLKNLLPNPNDGCWDSNGGFISDCAAPESLDIDDFNSAAVVLGAAASKTGKITMDLVQYLNRFLKITRDTNATLATSDILPALYEDCWEGSDPWDQDEVPPAQEDLEYDLYCEILAANPDMPGWTNYAEFTNVKELFVDFSKSNYRRNSSAKANLILEGSSTDIWEGVYNVSPFKWVANYPNPEKPAKDNIQNFVGAASDVLRAIEYIHNYATPDDLYCKYAPAECQ